MGRTTSAARLTLRARCTQNCVQRTRLETRTSALLSASDQGRLSSAFEPTGRPVDLTLATTLLDGVQNVTVDVLGQRIPDIAYDGRFRFSHDELCSDGAARALELAARCSAGFPETPARRDAPPTVIDTLAGCSPR